MHSEFEKMQEVQKCEEPEDVANAYEALNQDVQDKFVESGDPEKTSLSSYLMSIVFMPKSLRVLCLTNLLCWMSHVCYSLYFTDFVGEAVFGGNPTVSSWCMVKTH